MTFNQLQRREFLGVVGVTACWPIAARTQQPGMPVIGFLNPGSADAFAYLTDAFRRSLAEVGYVTTGQPGTHSTEAYMAVSPRRGGLPVDGEL
jgi:hypothetical protein